MQHEPGAGVFGIPSGYDYLRRLRTIDGGMVSAERIGSQLSRISNMPIDSYQIFNAKQEEIAIIYISPYHRKNSAKAPKGFMLIDRTAKD